MEYAAVFLLFVLLTASAVRLTATGTGVALPAFLVVVAALLCLEPAGEGVNAAPSCIFLACTGAAYIGYKRDFAALLCAAATAVITVSALFNASAGIMAREWGYFCAIALCAVVNKPLSAGCVLALGVVLGDTYSLFSDHYIVYRIDLFSQITTYSAIICAVACAFVNSILKVFARTDGCAVSSDELGGGELKGRKSVRFI